jgi:hypothetical protein
MNPKRWAWFAVGLLVAHFGLMCWAVVICTRAGNAAVIPNYYDKAVHFDEAKAARAREAAAATRPVERP